MITTLNDDAVPDVKAVLPQPAPPSRDSRGGTRPDVVASTVAVI